MAAYTKFSKVPIQIGLILLFICTLGSLQASNLIKETLRCDGMERTYTLYLPENLPADAPLVLVLHGYGQTVKPEKYNMMPTADRYGFAVCYPQGEKDGKGKPSWNVGYACQQGYKVDDVKFLCTLAKHLQKKYKLSKPHTFCTGMSNGGEMCYLLAYERPDVFAAVASISGLTMEWMYKTCQTKRPIPLMEVHGTEDRVSEWNGDLENKGGWGAYVSVPLAVGVWVAHNRCTTYACDTLPIKNTTNGHRVIAHRYSQGKNGTQVWLYQVMNGKHSWGTDDLDTAEEIWKFFSATVLRP